MSILDELETGMTRHLTAFVRLRARQVTNPYNPSATSNDWTQPDELTGIMGAFTSSSSTRLPDGLDQITTSRAVLTVFDPSVDIQVGDRIRPEPAGGLWNGGGALWQVVGVPAVDVNPFTGWQPSMEIQLEEVKGT